MRIPPGIIMPHRLAALFIAVVTAANIAALGTDSPTMDEPAYISGGYGTLWLQDYRLDNEHPPLVKDLAAFPLGFLDLHFPIAHSGWTRYQDYPDLVELQYLFGVEMYTKSGASIEVITFWSRLPLQILFPLLGWVLFAWGRELFGPWGGLGSVVLYCCAPNLLAHSRYVTMDFALSAGLLATHYHWWRWCRKPTRTTLAVVAFLTAATILTKYTALVLVITLPCSFFLFRRFTLPPPRRIPILRAFLTIMLVTFVSTYAVYVHHTAQMPVHVEVRLIRYIFELFPHSPAWTRDWLLEGAFKPILRPLIHWAAGLVQNIGRGQDASYSFLWGEGKIGAWFWYFPLAFLMKTPWPSIGLLVIGGWGLIRRIKRNDPQRHRGTGENSREKSPLMTMVPQFEEGLSAALSLGFLTALFFLMGLTASTNIGIRWILPVFPPLILLAASGLTMLWKGSWWDKGVASGALVVQCLMVWSWYPTFLPWMNPGFRPGYKYLTDSNVDWGQDLKRLAEWGEKEGVQEIYLDYFGRIPPEAYLGAKYRRFHWDDWPSRLPEKGWFAVSASYFWRPEAFRLHEQELSYVRAFSGVEPRILIGGSLLVFHLEDVPERQKVFAPPK